MVTAVLAVLASCERIDVNSGRAHRPGDDIVFGAENKSLLGTKTSYSGITDAADMERVNWISGDRIRIYCAEAEASTTTDGYSDYDVAESGENGKTDAGSLSTSGVSMKWGDTEKHVFYSVYPVPGESGVQAGVAMDANVVTAVLPSDQSFQSPLTNELSKDYYADMKLAYMTAAATGQLHETGDILLSFTPIVTTFYVTVKNPDASAIHVKKVKLSSSSSPLCGTYKAVLSESNDRTYTYKLAGGSYVNYGDYALTDSNSSISATFSGNGVELAQNETLTVALFALPHTIGNLTLTVVSTENGTSSLDIKDDGGNWLSFTGGNKHNLNNIGLPTLEYRLSVDKVQLTYDYTGVRSSSAQDFTVTSGRIVNGSTETLGGWVTMVKTGSGTDDWTPLADVLADSNYSWLTGLPLSSEGLLATDVSKLYQEDVAAQEVTSHVDRLKNATELGTMASPVDLSRWDFVNRTQDSGQYTANCYVIQAPGWYMFPLVYGNGVENGTINQGSYVGQNGAGHLNNFGNYNNNSIRNAWIESDRAGTSYITCNSTRIHWQQYSVWDDANDVPVTSGGLYSNASYTDPQVLTNIDIISGSGGRYIRFYVSPENIRPGNALIAALNSDGDVVWSWHIWITDQSMNLSVVNNGSSSYTILPVNLGWIDLGKGQFYQSRRATLRFDSTEKEGLCSGEMVVEQAECETVSTQGWSTYYQWGRKDPFVEGLFTVHSDDTNTGGSVRHPSNLFWDTSTYRLVWSGSLNGTYYDWVIENYNNLWDSQCTKYGIKSTVTMNTNDPVAPSGNLPTYKTVYDPSPRKFCVSPDYAWNSFSSGHEGGFDKGYFFYTTTGTTFFPAAGYIDHETGALQAKEGGGYYWTNHATYGVQCRISYTLNFTSSAVNTLYYQNMNRADARSVRSVSYDNAYSGPTIVFPEADTFIDFADMSLSEGQDMTLAGVVSAPFTITFATNDGSSSPAYHNQQSGNNPTYYADGVYLYSAGSILTTRNGNSFTITANGTERIISIQLTLGEESGASISANSGSFDADTLEWSGNASSVTFTLSHNGDMRSLLALTVGYNFS